MEDVFALLKAEDDNPRGQAGGRYLSGDSLEAAAAAEQRRLEIKAARWTKGRQEEGILLLIKGQRPCSSASSCPSRGGLTGPHNGM